MIRSSIGPVFSTGGAADRGTDDLAENYHEASKITRVTHTGWTDVRFLQLISGGNDGSTGLGEATSAPGLLPSIPLADRPALSLPLSTALERRGSAPPEALGGGLTFAELSTVLHYAYCERADGAGRRFVPSGGALYPLDVYVVVRDVDGLTAGIYQLDPLNRSLVDRFGGGGAERIARFSNATPTLMVQVPRVAAATLIVTASFERARYKYGLRGYRLSLFEAGHVMQNAALVATALGLNSLGWVGFIDHEIDDLLELDGVTQSALYAFSLGGGGRGASR